MFQQHLQLHLPDASSHFDITQHFFQSSELLNIIIIFLLLKRKTDHSAARFDAIGNALERLEKNIKDEFRYLQENTSKGARENREELSKSLGDFRTENSHILKNITGQNLQSLEAIHKTLHLQLHLPDASSHFDITQHFFQSSDILCQILHFSQSLLDVFQLFADQFKRLADTFVKGFL